MYFFKYFNEGASCATCVLDEEFALIVLDLGMEPGNTLIEDQYLVGRMTAYLSTLLLDRIERILWPIILLYDKLKFLPFLFFLLIDHNLRLLMRIPTRDHLMQAKG